MADRDARGTAPCAACTALAVVRFDLPDGTPLELCTGHGLEFHDAMTAAEDPGPPVWLAAAIAEGKVRHAPTIVVAPSFLWFENWCGDNGHHPRDKRFRVVTSAADVRRLRGVTPAVAHLVIVGWPVDGRDWAHIRRHLRIAGFDIEAAERNGGLC